MSNKVRISDDVFYIDSFLSQQECHQYIQLTEAKGYQEARIISAGKSIAAPEIRNNERVIIDSSEIASAWWKKAKELLPTELDGSKIIGFNERFRFYRYKAKQQFRLHKDFPFQRPHEKSKLSCIVYLNDNFTGGTTDFRTFEITPVTGRAVVFRHELLHEGTAVRAGTKYAVRTDVMFQD